MSPDRCPVLPSPLTAAPFTFRHHPFPVSARGILPQPEDLLLASALSFRDELTQVNAGIESRSDEIDVLIWLSRRVFARP